MRYKGPRFIPRSLTTDAGPAQTPGACIAMNSNRRRRPTKWRSKLALEAGPTAAAAAVFLWLASSFPGCNLLRPACFPSCSPQVDELGLYTVTYVDDMNKQQTQTVKVTDTSTGPSPIFVCPCEAIIGVELAKLIQATARPSPATVGNQLTYDFQVSSGGTQGTAIAFSDTLPDNVTFVSATAESIQGDPNNPISPRTPVACQSSGRAVTCNFRDFDSATRDLISIVVVPTVLGKITDTASVELTDDAGDKFDDSTRVSNDVNPPMAAGADLAVTISGSLNPVAILDTLTYAIAVTNNGPGAAMGVVLTEKLQGNQFAPPTSASQGTCTASVSGTTATMTCNLGDLASGANATVKTSFSPVTAGTLTDTATVTASTSDPTPDDNTATVMTTVAVGPDLSVTISASPDPVSVGKNLTYIITITNNGPGTATGITLSDAFSSAVIPVSGISNCAQSGSSFFCSPGSLPSGASTTLTVVVAPTVAGPITSLVKVSAFQTDPNPANNTASVTTTVQ